MTNKAKAVESFLSWCEEMYGPWTKRILTVLSVARFPGGGSHIMSERRLTYARLAMHLIGSRKEVCHTSESISCTNVLLT